MPNLSRILIATALTLTLCSGCRTALPQQGTSLPDEPAGQLLRTDVPETTSDQREPAETVPPPPSADALPTVPAEEPAKPASDRAIKLKSAHTVAGGELLWSIAMRPDVYGDPLLWPLLYQANRDQIKDPRQIYPGQTLAIPRNLSEQQREDARSRARKSDIFPVDQILPGAR